MKSVLFRSSLFAVICCLFLFISSCKKDEVKKSRNELLLGSWILTSDFYSPAFDVDANGTKETEVFPLYNACSKDDLLTFKAGGTGESDQGALMCSNNPNQKSPFSWSLFNNDYTLVISGESYSLLELSETTLKIAYTFRDTNNPNDNTTYTNTYTFSRKQ